MIIFVLSSISYLHFEKIIIEDSYSYIIPWIFLEKNILLSSAIVSSELNLLTISLFHFASLFLVPFFSPQPIAFSLLHRIAFIYLQ